MFANGAGTSFVNHGVMNVGAWTLDGNQPDLQNYAVAVTGGATASNAGTINVGVNATTLDSQVIGGLVAGGSFTNEAGGTITLGRSAQYAPGGPANDVALAAHAYGILLGNSGTASNLGTIVIGSQTQNGAALASIGSASGTLTNAGAIVVNGAASGTPLANVGMRGQHGRDRDQHRHHHAEWRQRHRHHGRRHRCAGNVRAVERHDQRRRRPRSGLGHA